MKCMVRAVAPCRRAIRQGGMRTVPLYRQQAAGLRVLAKTMSHKEHRNRLLRMAQEWDSHGDERQAQRLLEANVRVRARSL